MPDDLADIRSHIGTREADSDVATAAPVLLFQKTLGRQDLEPEDGAAIPPGWHMLYFLPRFEQAELGPDGAPASSGVIPEMPSRAACMPARGSPSTNRSASATGCAGKRSLWT